MRLFRAHSKFSGKTLFFFFSFLLFSQSFRFRYGSWDRAWIEQESVSLIAEQRPLLAQADEGTNERTNERENARMELLHSRTMRKPARCQGHGKVFVFRFPLDFPLSLCSFFPSFSLIYPSFHTINNFIYISLHTFNHFSFCIISILSFGFPVDYFPPLP